MLVTTRLARRHHPGGCLPLTSCHNWHSGCRRRAGSRFFARETRGSAAKRIVHPTVQGVVGDGFLGVIAGGRLLGWVREGLSGCRGTCCGEGPEVDKAWWRGRQGQGNGLPRRPGFEARQHLHAHQRNGSSDPSWIYERSFGWRKAMPGPSPGPSEAGFCVRLLFREPGRAEHEISTTFPEKSPPAEWAGAAATAISCRQGRSARLDGRAGEPGSVKLAAAADGAGQDRRGGNKLLAWTSPVSFAIRVRQRS